MGKVFKQFLRLLLILLIIFLVIITILSLLFTGTVLFLVFNTIGLAGFMAVLGAVILGSQITVNVATIDTNTDIAIVVSNPEEGSNEAPAPVALYSQGKIYDANNVLGGPLLDSEGNPINIEFIPLLNTTNLASENTQGDVYETESIVIDDEGNPTKKDFYIVIPTTETINNEYTLNEYSFSIRETINNIRELKNGEEETPVE